MTRVLVVEDDLDLTQLLAFSLGRWGFEVLATVDPTKACEHVRHDQPAIAIVDLNLGPWNGFELLTDLRQWSQIPVLILTGRDGEEDKVQGFELGADDYLTKPFSHRELLARLRALLKRCGHPNGSLDLDSGVLKVGLLTVDSSDCSVTRNGERLELTVSEFRLLKYLAINAGQVLSLQTIAKHVWGYDDTGARNIVRVAIYRLRRKLEPDSSTPQILQTVAGAGVILRATP